jgi:uncharacterized protein
VRLTPVQMRILGSLMEKERTTPDNYPLTLNALLLACNQTTNRQPVVKLDDKTVGNALLNLRGMDLIRVDHSRSNRGDKYRQVLDEALRLDRAESAVLCVLMLRGPQTPGELRARTERLHHFRDQREIDDALRRLAGRPDPLVLRLERQPGQKESRWAQLVGGGLPAGEAAAAAGSADPEDRDHRVDRDPDARDPDGLDPDGATPAPGRAEGSEARIAALESALAAVRADLDQLRAEYDELARELR